MFKGMIYFADRRVIPWMMAVFFFLALIMPCNALSTTSAIPQVLSKQITGKVTEPDTATRARIVESYSRLPLSFEANHGQTDGKVKFLSRGSGYNLFLASTEAVLSLRKPQPPKARIKDKAGKEPALHKADKPEPATVVAMKLVGANPDPKITGANQLPGKVNYFLGKDPKKWRTNIPTYARVRYSNVYPGIDLVFYGQGQKLEYDFIVAPGADPEAIALCFGQTPLKIDQNGDLALDAKGGELRLQKPLIYQDIDGIRKPVPGGYVLHPVKNEKQTHRVGFKVAAYDRARPLVIDPVLVYSTYLGGSSDDYGQGIAVDATGNCYVTGLTDSTDFPTQDPFYPNNAGDDDVFVTRLSPAGDALVYSTYLGGSSSDIVRGIAVDAIGNCYVTGDTYSTDFPTQDPVYPNNAGYRDAFVTKLSPAGDALVYSTYLGGSGSDYGYGVAVDATGNCYVTGLTGSTDFPTQDPVYPNNAGNDDAFVTKLSPAGDALVYSTYLGGSSSDNVRGIAVDATGNCYVTGYTFSTDFPTQDPLYLNNAGYYDAFVTRLSPAGDALVYSTYLGGSSGDGGNGIAVDATGNCYVTGRTFSPDFPTQDPLYQNYAGSGDAFVTSLSPAGDALVYSTYLGGSSEDNGRGIAVDATGNCYVTGYTYSTNFPTKDPFYPIYAGSADAFVTSLNPAGVALVYSTYLGGSSGDYGHGIAVDAIGNCYVTGSTNSTDFPTQDPLYPDNTGEYDVFVSKLSARAADFTADPTAGTVPLTVNFTDLSTGDITFWFWDFGDGGTSKAQNPFHTYNTPYAYTVSLTVTGPEGTDTETKIDYITVTEPAPVAGFSATPTTGTVPLAVSFTDFSTGSITDWSWNFGDGGTSEGQNPSHTYNTPGAYTVSLTVTGPGGTNTETKIDYITVTEPAPVADFSATPTTGTAPLAVNFTDLSTGSITDWAWNFGDGGTSTAQNPTHTYNTPYAYTVSLTVTGPGGSDKETKIDYINVGYAAPEADFSADPTTGTAPLAVNFTDLSTGSITDWAWNFGDGGTSTAQNPIHRYNWPGAYTVSLTVTGPGGTDTETKIDYITVTASLPDVSVTLAPDDTVIPRGGTLGVGVTITNNTNENQIVYFATNVTLPNGNPYPPSGYLFGPYRVTLNPYQSKSGHLSHTIPGKAPLGTYTYHGYVGKPGKGIIDQDQFDFEVTSPKQAIGPEDWETTVDKAFAE